MDEEDRCVTNSYHLQSPLSTISHNHPLEARPSEISSLEMGWDEVLEGVIAEDLRRVLVEIVQTPT